MYKKRIYKKSLTGSDLKLPYLEVKDQKTYYAGDLEAPGIPVIFCHGSGGRHHHWVYQIRGLRGEEIKPLAVDLPGHGKSEGSPLESIENYRDWLGYFAEAAGLAKFVVAGHSMGGAIALAYALEYPEQISGLILVGSGGRLRVLPALLEALKAGTVPSTFADYLYGPYTGEKLIKEGKKDIAETAASLYYTDLSACDNFDVMEELPRIDQQVLIICGSEDRLTPVKYSTYLQQKLPKAELVIIDGAGHMVMLEKPEAVNSAICAYVKTL